MIHIATKNGTVITVVEENESIEEELFVCDDCDIDSVNISKMEIEHFCGDCEYKFFYNRTMNLPTCNECLHKKTCEHVPKWGNIVRYNCPHFKGE